MRGLRFVLPTMAIVAAVGTCAAMHVAVEKPREWRAPVRVAQTRGTERYARSSIANVHRAESTRVDSSPDADGGLVVTGLIERRAGVLKMTLTSIVPARLAPRTVVSGMPLDEAFKELSRNGWVTVKAGATAGFWSKQTKMTYVLKRPVTD